MDIINKININGTVRENEDMSIHTTFKCGGKAEIFISVKSVEDILKIKSLAREHNIPIFILGGGANILVSDKGIPGITIYLGELNKVYREENVLIAESGISVNSLCEFALNNSLSGLEFIYGMPGTLGGAVWMNARCYGDEISSSFLWAEFINQNGEVKKQYFDSKDWDYKISPFQSNNIIITKIALQLKPGNKDEIYSIMEQNNRDRNNKGHFKFPCAGSVFKNNRDFGEPSGKIIEDSGLKGLVKGEAQISEFHANIIVNLGKAKSSDIDYLINEVIKTVYNKKGYILEPEVLKVGLWE